MTTSVFSRSSDKSSVRLVMSIFAEISCPRCTAICSITLPIFPYPKSAIRILQRIILLDYLKLRAIFTPMAFPNDVG